MATLSRRAFLQLKADSQRRIAELSCERLYMRFLDAQLQGSDAADAAHEAESERAPVFEGDSSADALFESLARELMKADELRLTERSWLLNEEFRARLEPVLAAFQARGGVIVEARTPGSGTDSPPAVSRR
jgi:hypothetical protein